MPMLLMTLFLLKECCLQFFRNVIGDGVGRERENGSIVIGVCFSFNLCLLTFQPYHNVQPLVLPIAFTAYASSEDFNQQNGENKL